MYDKKRIKDIGISPTPKKEISIYTINSGGGK